MEGKKLYFLIFEISKINKYIQLLSNFNKYKLKHLNQ